MTAIETHGLTKRFDDVVAVDDLELAVREGEVFGFLGPNGAGKSTVIDLLLDFVRPTGGSATVLGHDPRSETAAIRRKTGVLPEGAELYDRLTGREHLAWIARANGVEEDVDALLERVGLSEADAERRAGGYSTGMGQRLAFGMALVGDPDLLILDEPTSGLDPAGIREFRDLVRAAADAGRTVFFSSHRLGEVQAVCDRVGILNDGHLVATGTPEELRAGLDLGASIRFEVAQVPDDLGLADVEGVEAVSVDETTVCVRLSDATAKVDAVTHLAERARVLDLVSTDASLERLFDSYTTGSPSPEVGGDGDTPLSRSEAGLADGANRGDEQDGDGSRRAAEVEP